MRIAFGDYVLDEAARSLSLRGEAVAVQPLVLELLLYLARNTGRAVPKSELLDALWPGVTVTEASLQRAVSLARAALRPGGMDRAIRSHARFGYRFGLDEPGFGSLAPAVSVASGAEAAHAALARRDWRAAAAAFAAQDAASPLAPPDLDRWAFALACRGEPSEAIGPLGRAVAAHAAAGAPEAAARSAIELATIHLERGETAVANGWTERAGELLGASEDPAARGRLAYMQARIAGALGQPERALELAEAACAAGRAAGSAEVTALGLVYRGLFRLCLGDTPAGIADQDHAAAIGLSGDIDPITGATVYCCILWSCRSFGDWSRAEQWTLGFTSWCAGGLADQSGTCELHRAEVLTVQGTLGAARVRVEAALARLPREARWAVGDGHRVLGDIHAALGELGAARAAYARAEAEGWDAEPGQAMLRLESGDARGALAGLEHALDGQGWWQLQRAGLLRAHRALALAALGRTAEARAEIAALQGDAVRWPMPAIRALCAEAAARLAPDRREAVRQLHLARQLWTSVASEPNAARLRLALADALAALGETTAAAAEIAAARAAGARIGSPKVLAGCDAADRRLAAATAPARSAG